MTDADVVVCGLGPVGQLLALLLADRGVRVLALEREIDPYPLPRAAVIDDEVLRILQAARVDRTVLADAQVHPSASIVTGTGRVVEVLCARARPLGHPPLVSINQPSLERTLLDALATRQAVTVRRGSALVSLRERGEIIEARLSGGETMTARYLVGCDGAASGVRALLGIPFTGRTAPQRWLVVDARVAAPLQRVPHPYFVGRAARPLVTLPMSPGRHRWEFMLRPGEDPAPLLAPAALERALAAWLDGVSSEIERAVVYTFHSRMAARWRSGRVLLAGDAAHVMPPFAGQGLGAGVRDVGNLAWKLAAALDGAPEVLLDTYAQERRPHVRAMQRTAALMGALVQTSDPRLARARDAVLHTLDGTPIQRWLTTNVKPLPTYGAGAFAHRPARIPMRRTVGTLFPQSDRLDDRLGSGWSVVALAAAPDFAAAAIPVVHPGSDGAWLRRRGLSWALLRPDRYVFAVGRAGDGVAVARALAAWRRWCAATGGSTPTGARILKSDD